MVTPVPHTNYSYKAFCQIEPVFNRVKQIKNAITPYIADSMKFAFSIGNCALGSHCLVVSQANNNIAVSSIYPNAQCPITNDQVPKKPSRIRYIIYTRTCKWMKLILPLSRICVRMLLKACIVHCSRHLIAMPQQVSVKSFLYSQTVDLKTDSKILYYSILKLKYTPSIFKAQQRLKEGCIVKQQPK